MQTILSSQIILQLWENIMIKTKPKVDFKVIHMQGIGKYKVEFNVTNLNDRRKKYRYEFDYISEENDKIVIEPNYIYFDTAKEANEILEYLHLMMTEYDLGETLDKFIHDFFGGDNEQKN
jgi:hypothetical protein